ncbi:aldo/keto reductase [Microbacterium sp. NIBRBAC000506063]|uniref:aldo/keto reductase n=1 Tax=Microbacterium sp. NIBRBAC000506063 TaxID=2734618 RepID=UPI0021D4139B|nr:aldo/keto reductase [Microbacterium sp. NIBRBAC000506063]
MLRTDRIDLYFLHFPDPAVPFAESVGALEELRGEGRIARIGLCNVDSEQLDIALGIAPIAAVQHRHAIGAPAPAELLARCHSHDIAFLGYSPLGGGGAREVLDAASVPGSPPHGSPPSTASPWHPCSSPSFSPRVRTSASSPERDAKPPSTPRSQRQDSS